nr:hypothetical protein QOL21_06105 [Acholeplasma laidlawii]
MKEKGLIKALFMFIISLVTLSVSVFAWFAVSQQANIGQIIGQTADYSAILVFKVKKMAKPIGQKLRKSMKCINFWKHCSK